MKYWVYKDSRILGPFDKDAVAGLPGLDASTLVSAGESAAAGEGDWRPAGDIADLAALPLDRGPAWPVDDLSSTFGLLDKLQLDAAGLIGDDEFPGAAEDLFQDADMKRTFGDLLAPRPNVDEGELRRARDRAAELTVQLELLYKRVAELEAGQTNLVHRLAEKEMLLRRQPVPPPSPAVESFLREAAASAAPPPVPAPAPAPASVPPPFSAPPAAFAPPPAAGVPPPAAATPSDWPSVPAAAGTGAFPSFPSLGAPGSPSTPPAVLPAAPVPPLPPATAAAAASAPAFAPEPGPAPAVDWSAPPPLPPAPALPAETPAAAEPVAKKPMFARKTFKIVPTTKAFRVVGPEEAAAVSAAPVSTPAPESAVPSVPAPVEAAPAPAAAPFDWGTAPAPSPALGAAAEPVSAPPPIALTPTIVPPEPVPTPAFETAAPVPAFESPTQPAVDTATPAPAPPATLSFGAAKPESAPAPMPSFSNPGRSFTPGGGTAAAPKEEPPSTAVFRGGDDMADAPSTQAALARLAKPAPAPATEAPRPPRSNKPFLIGAGVLVVVMAVVGALFLRHPKDLKQMAELDDGRARLGAEPTDDATRPPLVKPKMAAPPADVAAASPSQAPAADASPAPAAPPQAPPAATQAASESKLDAAVNAVKSFPLDGDRGTVAQWLQFSYSAAPDAGKESWSASETADKTYLVEYRFSPARGGDDVHYLFEVDMDNGFVIGKNLDAKSVLAGGPRIAAETKPKAKPRKKAAKKASRRPAKRTADDVTPKEVPLLPLPDAGELRPPAEDDGAFNADTVNSGL